MAYSSRFVLGILLNGNVVQERQDGIVPIQFSSEYGIRCRNRHKDRRALVKLFVDGENISDKGFIIDKDKNLDIFRRVDVDAALKFVELTSEEAELTGKTNNGDGSKGVIEAHFYLEKKSKTAPMSPVILPQPTSPQPYTPYTPTPPFIPYQPPYTPTPTYPSPWVVPITPTTPWIDPYTPYYPQKWTDNTNVFGSNSWLCSSDTKCSVNLENMGSSSLLESPLLSPPTAPRKLLEEGCTVDGGLTGQRFIEEDFTPEKNFIVMKLVLRGFNANDDKVESATKPTHCTHCGQKKGRKADRFCGKCGYKI